MQPHTTAMGNHIKKNKPLFFQLIIKLKSSLPLIPHGAVSTSTCMPTDMDTHYLGTNLAISVRHYVAWIREKTGIDLLKGPSAVNEATYYVSSKVVMFLACMAYLYAPKIE